MGRGLVCREVVREHFLAEVALELRLNESQPTGHEIPANGANVNRET